MRIPSLAQLPTRPILTLFLALLLACSPAIDAQEKIVGLPCEGCEAVFQGGPGGDWSGLASSARIAPAGETGEALVLEGTVADAAGKPVPGVVVYAYQTDAGGIYPRDASLPAAAARHGRLRGFARTDAAGGYRFETIRPGGYPGTDIPQHIHLHLIEPGRCSYYIDDVVFDDDPRLTARQRAAHLNGRGGVGLVVPSRRGSTWSARRDIVLGKGIPGYSGCGSSS